MDYQEIISTIFETVLIPLLGVLTTALVLFIKNKIKIYQSTLESEEAKKYSQMLSDTITSCVIATNQTYVDSLKKAGKFDAEAQKEAFNKTYLSVLYILSEDAKKYLSNMYGDLEVYLIKKIETIVNDNKLEGSAMQ